MCLNYQDDESRFPWLSLLFDAYAIIDEGVAFAVKKEEKRRKVKLACRKGCSHCCRTHQDIPVYQLELQGIYWYASGKMDPAAKESLKRRIENASGGCPFLIENSCSIHPVRPVSCRQFNVFVRPCAEGEDPYYTRRGDVLTPIESFTDRAFSAMLSYYGFRDGELEDKMFRTMAVKEVIHTRAESLRVHDWRRLSEVMDSDV